MKGLHTVILILLVSKCILDTYLLIYTDNWLEYDLEGKFGAYQLTYGVFHHCLMTTEIGRCIKTLPHHIDIDNAHHVVQGLSAAALVLEGLMVILHALFICYAVRKTGFVIISVLMTIDGILACILTGLFVLKRHDWLKDTPSRILYPVYCYAIAAAATILLAVGLLIYIVKLTNNNSNNNRDAVHIELQDIQEMS